MKLNILTRGQVSAAIGAVVADISQHAKLARIANAGRDFHPQHLESRLALSVSAVLQAKGAELIVSNLAADKLSDTLFEHTDFLFDGFARVPRVNSFSLQHGWLPK